MSSTTRAPKVAASNGARPVVWPLYPLAGSISAGYGVMFTLVGDYGEAYGLSETELGVMIGIGFIVSFLAQTTLGPLGDRGLARALIVSGVAANVFGLLLMGYGTTATVLFAGRILSGLGMGAVFPAVRRLVVVGSGDDVGRRLGWLFSAEVFGFAVGPVVSAVLADSYGLAAPYLVIIGLSLALAGVAFARATMSEVGELQPTRFALDLLKDRAFAAAVLLGATAYVMIGAFDMLWDVVHEDLETPTWLANVGISVFALPLVLLGPFSGRLAQRRGPFLVAGLGLTVAGLFMGTYGVLGSGVAIFAVTMLHAVTDGLSFAASGVAVGIVVPENRQAGGQGVLGGVQSLAAGIMAPITGWVYDGYGQRAAYWTAAAVILAMVAAAMVVAGPSLKVRGQTPHPKRTQTKM